MISINIIVLSLFYPFIDTKSSDEYLPLLMPGVKPDVDDIFLCKAFKMNSDEAEYIIEFEPRASAKLIHHMLIFGCDKPGFTDENTIWNCKEGYNVSTFPSAPSCHPGTDQQIYSWGLDAPTFRTPKDVGFKVGGDSGVDYLVLHIHYNYKNQNAGDNSGIILKKYNRGDGKVPKRAGILWLNAGYEFPSHGGKATGIIPANAITNMEVVCPIDQDIELHPFAYRVNSDRLGKVVTGWIVHPDGNWTLLAKNNPTINQAFNLIETSISIKQKDLVAARCVYVNTNNYDVKIGLSGFTEETCNFDLMYYVDGDQILDTKQYFSKGAPQYYWKTDPSINSIPASVDYESNFICN